MGGLEMLFPCAGKEQYRKYEAMLRKSHQIFESHLSDNKRQKYLVEELQLPGSNDQLPSQLVAVA